MTAPHPAVPPDRPAPTVPGRRVALVHEWLASHAGSEKVVEQILKVYPEAELFSVVDFLDDEQRAFVQQRHAKTSFIQRLPGARKHFRAYLPLMPLAIEQLDLSGFDLVISSNHAVAKGVITGPDQLHVCYVHSPMRYAWDLQHQYLQESGLTRGPKSWITRALLHYLRNWDARSAAGVDCFVANSQFIARRVQKVYRRVAHVIHPPVNVDRFVPGGQKEDFYLVASRLVPYKRIPMIAAAFSRMPERRLVVIGDGPEMEKLKACAGPNVQVLGFQDDAVLVDYMQRAKAFVFAAEEDFGIAPVEAQACGTPVIAYRRGGNLDTVRGDGPPAQRTGLFFDEQTEEAVIDAVQAFEALPQPIDPETVRRHAESFSEERFRAAFRAFVEHAWDEFKGNADAHARALQVGLRVVEEVQRKARQQAVPPPMKAAHPTAATASAAPPHCADDAVEPVEPASPPVPPNPPAAAPKATAMKRDLPDEIQPDFPPTELMPPADEAPDHEAQPIGQILRVARSLSDSDVAHILEVQVRMGVKFGEAAQALALVSREDVLWALSQQFRFRYPRQMDGADRHRLIMLGDPYGAPAEAFRDLRSQIITHQQRVDRRPLAVVSPCMGEGRSFVAANLALSFCQAGERTVLVDANLREPAVHRLLGIPERPSLSSLLCGQRIERPFDRSRQMPSLYVMQAGTPPPNPLELLDQPVFRRLLDGLNREFDRVIVDTPAAETSADARVIATACGQAILVGRKHRSAAQTMKSLHTRLSKLDVDVLGVVMNEV